jgi:hypothetical protein
MGRDNDRLTLNRMEIYNILLLLDAIDLEDSLHRVFEKNPKISANAFRFHFEKQIEDIKEIYNEIKESEDSLYL